MINTIPYPTTGEVPAQGRTSDTAGFMQMCYDLGMKNYYCSGKAALAAGDYVVEEDRLNTESFTIFEDLEKLKEDFEKGNWCLGQAFIFGDLCFMNQIDGGDEWLTIKRFGDEAISFESISMRATISDGRFKDMIGRLQKATKEQCMKLTY